MVLAHVVLRVPKLLGPWELYYFEKKKIFLHRLLITQQFSPLFSLWQLASGGGGSIKKLLILPTYSQFVSKYYI